MSLKDDVITKAYSYRGIQEGGPEHRAIIESYNSHKPLARGYAVKLSDAWCMTFISHLFISCGPSPRWVRLNAGVRNICRPLKRAGCVYLHRSAGISSFTIGTVPAARLTSALSFP